VPRELQEVDILEINGNRMERGSGRIRTENAHFMLAAGEMSADDMEFGFELSNFVVGGDHSRPNLSVERSHSL
jgi:hypothetical protein